MAKPKLVTPAGIVKFPSIEKPDPKGKYRIALVLDPKDKAFGDLIAQIDEAEKDFEKKYRGKPHYKKDMNIVNGEKVESGMVLMQFTSTFPMWDEKDSKIFDAAGNKIREDIGWGSKCKVAFVIAPYDQDGNVGVTRYIYGIQVLELKSSAVSMDACGFEPTEGYVKQEEKPKPYANEEERQKMVDANQISWDE
jgi:hypothetical protein